MIMSIPQYIKKNQSYISFANQTVVNQSVAQYQKHLLTIDMDGTYYLYFDNINQDKLSILVKENVQAYIYLISYNSKKTAIDLSIELQDNALLKLYSQFNARRKTSLSLNRVFNVSRNATLVLMNSLSYHGHINLQDDIYLNGQMASLDIDLLNINSQDDQSTVLQQVYHRAKKTYSQIHNWLISNASSKLSYVVNGSIEKGNEKSSCQQINKGIILSEQGEIKVIPSLFIDEYDVEASHGAAIGQIDENQMFYLRSRGMTELEAKNLIVSGYINPFLGKIKDQHIESLLKRRVKHLL